MQHTAGHQYLAYLAVYRRSRSSSCRLLRPINCQTYITLHYNTQTDLPMLLQSHTAVVGNTAAEVKPF